jgi:hypothetical protein
VSARDSDAPLVEDVWVEVPLTDLALHRAWHRSGKLWLDVTLPESGGARVELVDLAGRRVVTEPIPSGEAGRRQVAVTCTARSGVYFARVLHGTRSAHAKVVIAR